jgi:hypothetical protein
MNPFNPIVRKGVWRLWLLLRGKNHEQSREIADYWLFMIGVSVEIVLLLLVFLRAQQQESDAFARIIGAGLLFFLCIALALHQFLIFRNSSLPGVPERKRRVHEIMICFLFGVLTGEIGYLYVLGRSHYEPIVSWSDKLFGPIPGENWQPGQAWNIDQLGVALTGIFALGAAFLFFLVLLWDFRITRDLESRQRYFPQLIFFWVMDLLATGIWAAVAGVVLPNERLFSASRHSWLYLLGVLSLLYTFCAGVRLSYAVYRLGQHGTDKVALDTQVV